MIPNVARTVRTTELETVRRTDSQRHTELTGDYVAAAESRRDPRAMVSTALDLMLCAIAVHAVWLGFTHIYM